MENILLTPEEVDAIIEDEYDLEDVLLGKHLIKGWPATMSAEVLSFDRVDVGRHAVINRAIIDKDVQLPEGACIGVDLELDRARGFTVTDSGIVVIGKSDSVESGPKLQSNLSMYK